MLYRAVVIGSLGLSAAFMAPATPSKLTMSKVTMGGKGFGGGEATRDPTPTFVDPSDPKGKQQAIHKAESFADYLARRQGGQPAAAAPAAPAPAAPVSGAFDIADYDGVWGFEAKKAVFDLWDPE